MSLFLIEPSSINYSDDLLINEVYEPIFGVLNVINYSGALSFGITGGISDGASVYKDEPYGRLTVNIATGAYTFTPNSNYINSLFDNITDNFEFTVSDSISTTYQLLNLTVTQQDVSIYKYSGSEDDTLMGGGGMDSLFSGDGNDTVSGGDGDDTIAAGNGNDILTGGKGSDYLAGGEGSDTYIFNRGDGQDALEDYDVSDMADIDTIQFGAGISRSDIVFEIEEFSGLTLKIAGTSDKIMLSNAVGTINSDFYRIEQLKFADGTVWDFSATSGNDYLGGSIEADALAAGSGDDVYYINHNDDLITEHQGEGNDTVYSAVSYVLADNVENLYLVNSNNYNSSGGGNALDNVIHGDAGSNILTGAGGNDTLMGGEGGDTYIFNRGDGQDVIEDYEFANIYGYVDTIQFGVGIAPSDVVVSYEAGDIYLKIAGTSDQIRINNMVSETYRIEQYTFVDGTVWDFATLMGNLNPTSGDDYLIGSAGADSLSAGAGDDVYNVNHIDDVITENPDAGYDTVNSSISYTLAANVEKLNLVGSYSIDAIGNELDNVINGNYSENILIGGGGNDKLDGGEGSDTYIFSRGDGQDIITDFQRPLLYFMPSDTIQFTADIAPSDIIVSRDEYNIYLKIAGTNDQICIKNMLFDWKYRIEQVKFADGTIWDAETLLAKVMSPTSGDDYLPGNTAGDLLAGGMGDDTFVVNYRGDVIIENKDEGNDSVNSSISYALAANVENLTLTNTAAINGTGNELDNIITGNGAANQLDGGAGNDTLIGVGGNDTLIGGLGDDAFIIDSASYALIEGNGQGTDTVRSSVSYTLGANVENLTLTNTAAINGTGNELDNIITGNGAANQLDGGAGNDTLIGVGGNDTLIGGLGDDAFIIDSASYALIEGNDQGTDTVRSSVSYTLGANVENLTLTNTAAINGTGNELDNIITGNGAANQLDGGAGNDTLDGGLLLQYTPGISDTLIGGIGNDRFEVRGVWGGGNYDGGMGQDTLDFGRAEDKFDGVNSTRSRADDVYQGVHYGSVGIEADLSAGIAYTYYGTNGASNDRGSTITIRRIENVTGTQYGDRITGNGVTNRLDGGGGDDTLIGVGGNDTLIGGLGNDAFIIDSASYALIEGNGQGTDTVHSSVSYTLAANIENLTLTYSNAAINGIGNELDNVITGNGAANRLDGGAGNDTLIGVGGNDTLIGGLGNDTFIIGGMGFTNGISTYDYTVFEGINQGTDTVRSSVSYTLGANVENLTLTNNAANGTGNELGNTIIGNDAANQLNGGAGNDALTGGGGKDTFVFSSPLSAGNVDTINDFLHGTDKIALSAAIFTRLLRDTNLSDNLVLGPNALDKNDYLIYNSTNKALYYDADGSGAGIAVQFATLANVDTLSASDFVVI